MDLTHQKIAVLGCGRSGLAAARLARSCGASNIRLFDSNPCAACDSGDFSLTAGATEEEGRAFGADLVIISPGIEAEIPWTRAFAERARELIGETEFAFRHFHGTVIAITGTNGKTTTTALIEHILKKAGMAATACGNYGVPFCDVVLGEETNVAVLEVSSFQMETIRDFRPDMAVWLNFAPDHMDRYKTVNDYFQAKLRVFENMDSTQTIVVRQSEALPPMAPRMLTFGAPNGPCDPECNLIYRDGWICRGNTRLVDLNETTLSQAHNAENAMAATLVCRELGVSFETIQEDVRHFVPPGHRCEIVAEIDGILWLNDSKSTNLHSTEAAIRSQTRPIVLIAGGKDKGLDYAPIVPLLAEKARASIVFGQIGDQLADTFSPVVPTVTTATLDQAVAEAAKLARRGDVVLFSPGTSSFDQFSSYAERGECFRNAVRDILKI